MRDVVALRPIFRGARGGVIYGWARAVVATRSHTPTPFPKASSHLRVPVGRAGGVIKGFSEITPPGGGVISFEKHSPASVFEQPLRRNASDVPDFLVFCGVRGGPQFGPVGDGRRPPLQAGMGGRRVVVVVYKIKRKNFLPLMKPPV